MRDEFEYEARKQYQKLGTEQPWETADQRLARQRRQRYNAVPNRKGVPMQLCFLQGQYIITFSGADTGVIKCDSAEAMRSKVLELFDDKLITDHLLNPANWEPSNDTDFPFCVGCDTSDERGTTRVMIYRDEELST